ncbi:profilin-like isoform X1 [Tubulanus polymorphus]|uniref:profilin-like isoform X1 n=1 Tax=Tubulanus polymorphus TaxID=672921 RepID=UPI003DA1DF20
MSWDSYIDNLIEQAPNDVDKVWIGGKDGKPWTSSDHAHSFTLGEIEVDDVINIARACDGGDASTLQAGGVHLNGVKFQFLRADEADKMVLAKKKDQGYVTACTSKTAVVIVIGKETSRLQGNVNKAVKVITEHLESSGC